MASQGLTGTLGDVGEFGLIEALTARFPQASRRRARARRRRGSADRCGGEVVASVDLLVQDRHFRLDWSVGWTSGTRRPRRACPTSMRWAVGRRAGGRTGGTRRPRRRLGARLRPRHRRGGRLVGASVLGGDLSRADAITIAVTALGVCEHGVVRRSGAQPGDVVALAGRQGWAAAGFAVLGRGFRSPRVVVEAHRRPEPPYDAGPAGRRARCHGDDRRQRRAAPGPRSRREGQRGRDRRGHRAG